MIPVLKKFLGAVLLAAVAGAAADSLRAELETFADAIDGRAPFPVPPAQMLQTVAAFEAVIRSLASHDTAV